MESNHKCVDLAKRKRQAYQPGIDVKLKKTLLAKKQVGTSDKHTNKI